MGRQIFGWPRSSRSAPQGLGIAEPRIVSQLNVPDRDAYCPVRHALQKSLRVGGRARRSRHSVVGPFGSACRHYRQSLRPARAPYRTRLLIQTNFQRTALLQSHSKRQTALGIDSHVWMMAPEVSGHDRSVRFPMTTAGQASACGTGAAKA